MKLGVLIIGSLLWDKSDARKKWRKELVLAERLKVTVPIRYGRKSRKDGDRKGTYSMIYSNQASAERGGQGTVVPIRVLGTTEELKRQALLLGKAEGFGDNNLCKSWGSVAIIINPLLSADRQVEIQNIWNSVTRPFLNSGPAIEDFGVLGEEKSITPQLILNIETAAVFHNCPQIEVLLATANAVKFEDDSSRCYPNERQIAEEMFKSKYYDYFLQNRMYRITTFQDSKIAKVLKKKFRISLKKERLNLES